MEDPVAKMKPQVEQSQFGPWTLAATKSHILKSEGPERQRFESELSLPQLPEMIFAENALKLQHAHGYGVHFNALDALKLVDPDHDLMKVAVAKEWREARADCEFINDVMKPFDWTYTTDYKGTLLGQDDQQLTVSETTERIDMEKLKVREKIHFYADIMLFEDELADNGCSMLNVKIRVMPSSFFALLRFYLRVDSVLVRINDTRFYHEGDKDFILREFTSKEKSVADLKVPSHILIDPNEVVQYLDVKEEKYEKLLFPGQSKDSTNAKNAMETMATT